MMENHMCVDMTGLKAHDGYFCGACGHQFETICQLHKHLQGNHTSRGCYHYDSHLKTAFPKYDTVCCYTQTDGEDKTKKRAQPRLKSPSVKRLTKKPMKCTIKTNPFERVSEGILSNNCLNFTEEQIQDTANLLCMMGKSQPVDGKQNSTSENVQTNFHEKELKKYEDVTNQDSECTQKGKEKRIKKTVKPKEKLKSVKTLPHIKKTRKRTVGSSNTTDQVKPTKSKKKDTTLPSLSEIQLSAMQMENAVIDLPKCPSVSDKHSKTQEVTDLLDNSQTDLSTYKSEIKNLPFKHQRELDVDKQNNTENVNIHNTKVPNNRKKQHTAKTDCSKTDGKGVKVLKKSAESKTSYTCEQCGQTMPWNKKEVHERLHSGERPFACELCGKGLISKNKLKRHMLTHSKDKKHTCEVCGVGFQMKYKLRMHMHIHTGDKPYLCSICGAGFNHSSNLATHTRSIHNQVKPHTCSVCGVKFAKRSQLSDHMLSHSSEKQFTCRFCGKSFKYQKGLKRHEKSHEDDKSLRCGKCEAQFVHKADFLHHIDVAHKPPLPLQCSECKKIFATEEELNEHVKTDCDRKKYQCSVCGVYYKVCNEYFTHMLAAHGIEREQAKSLHSQHNTAFQQKTRNCSLKQAAVTRFLLKSDDKQNSKAPEQASEAPIIEQQDLFSPINVPNNDIAKTSNSGLNPSFNVRQMVTGLLEDNNKSTISALTRAATENLRLHSQDIQEGEKMNPLIIPQVNPSIILCTNADRNNFGITNSAISLSASHSLGDTMNNIVGVVAKPGNSSFNQAGVTRFCNNTNDIQINNNLAVQPDSSPYPNASRDALMLPDRNSNSNNVNLLNLTSGIGINQSNDFSGRIQPLNTICMMPMSNQAALLEHESTLALRRLAENVDSQVVSQSILPGTNPALMLHDAGNQIQNQVDQQSSTVGFRIQNLF